MWIGKGTRYSFLKEIVNVGEGQGHLSAEFFHFRSKLYLHVMTLYSGHGFLHDDEIFRVEQNSLTSIRINTPTPLKLASGESINKGVFQEFHDDDLRFTFGIWKENEPNCCPSSEVKGTYTTIGNEMRIQSWKREDSSVR